MAFLTSGTGAKSAPVRVDIVTEFVSFGWGGFYVIDEDGEFVGGSFETHGGVVTDLNDPFLDAILGNISFGDYFSGIFSGESRGSMVVDFFTTSASGHDINNGAVTQCSGVLAIFCTGMGMTPYISTDLQNARVYAFYDCCAGGVLSLSRIGEDRVGSLNFAAETYGEFWHDGRNYVDAGGGGSVSMRIVQQTLTVVPVPAPLLLISTVLLFFVGVGKLRGTDPRLALVTGSQ